MKKMFLTLILVLMTSSSALAHGSRLSFGFSFGVPLYYSYGYPTGRYIAPPPPPVYYYPNGPVVIIDRYYNGYYGNGHYGDWKSRGHDHGRHGGDGDRFGHQNHSPGYIRR
ncbi:hypothetical protein [Geobacter sp. DSM 9736]|uniref:hypothetical protein n=1 Tax=Geobacter sp. DSM 9736 TaxID=1277350 RepID=UPI0012FD2EF4|nr:hypothetical protein [Geobacter sp. DSM 9736]